MPDTPLHEALVEAVINTPSDCISQCCHDCLRAVARALLAHPAARRLVIERAVAGLPETEIDGRRMKWVGMELISPETLLVSLLAAAERGSSGNNR